MRLSEKFKEALDLLGFEVNKDLKKSHVLLVSELVKKGLSPKEVFSLDLAKRFEADAVYFRRFEDNRSPIPQIYIYDNTKSKFQENDYARIHRNLWSGCVIPVFIVIEKTKILIYDSREPVKIEREGITSQPLKVLDYANDAIRQFSARLFDNGTFWELPENQGHFLATTSAYYDLIDGLKRLRSKFIEESKLPAGTAHKLLVLSILIKYLEERGDEGGSMFAKTFFKRNFEAEDFCGVLRKGKVVELFDKLSKQFNGKIFEWDNQDEVASLKRADLNNLADYLDGKNTGGQYILWRKYSFAHLPVELISSVYEEFLGKDKKDVVYTPDFLVNLLVDECMQIDQPKEEFKVIDISCGSGIFLVKAYKRLVEWWRYTQYKSTGNLPNADLNVLKKILYENIYGVDIEEDATRLTVFSLALALCDLLSPKEIWTKLRFDDLTRKNIHASDFFTYLKNAERGEFDLVIGNPPFAELNKKQFDSIVHTNSVEINCKIPQNQLALLFLDKGMMLLKKDAMLCLILPSAPLLYNDTLEFRSYFFSRYNTLQILDFTNLSSVLFGKANIATCALFVENRTPDEDSIAHVTVRRTKAAKERIIFEIDHYDFHEVTKEEACNVNHVWKANLLGGGRVSYLISRLGELRSLREYLDNKENNGWVVGEGFIRGKPGEKVAEYLTGKLGILAKGFTASEYRVETIDIDFFYRRGPKDLFSAPLLLIKEILENGKIPLALLDFDAGFDSRIVGIHAPQRDATELKEIYESFVKYMKTYVFYIISTSSQSFVNFATAIQKKDLMNLPYPERHKGLSLSYAEKILRDDVLIYSLDAFMKNEAALVNQFAQVDDLTAFAKVYCKAINSVYEDAKHHLHLYSIIDRPSFNALVFRFGSKGDFETKIISSNQAEENIEELVYNSVGKSLRITRIIKIYEKNKIYLIKPKQLRYWLKSIALRDADETFDEILDAPELN